MHFSMSSEPLSEDVDSNWIMLQEKNRKRFLFTPAMQQREDQNARYKESHEQMYMSMHNQHVHNRSHSPTKMYEHNPYRITVPDSSNSSSNYDDNNVNYIGSSTVENGLVSVLLEKEKDVPSYLIHLEEPFNEFASDAAPFQSPLTLDEYDKRYSVPEGENCFNNHEKYCIKDKLNQYLDCKSGVNDSIDHKKCLVDDNDVANKVPYDVGNVCVLSTCTYNAPLLVPWQKHELDCCYNRDGNVHNSFVNAQSHNIKSSEASSLPSVLSKSAMSHVNCCRADKFSASEPSFSCYNNQHSKEISDEYINHHYNCNMQYSQNYQHHFRWIDRLNENIDNYEFLNEF